VYKSKIPKWLRQLLLTELAVVVVIILSIHPMFMPDGVSNYNGDERDAARQGLELFGPIELIFPPLLGRHVDAVEKVSDSDSESLSLCQRRRGIGSQGYHVTISDKTIFGLKETATHLVCLP
jgi:hypothetical protein